MMFRTYLFLGLRVILCHCIYVFRFEACYRFLIHAIYAEDLGGSLDNVDQYLLDPYDSFLDLC